MDTAQYCYRQNLLWFHLIQNITFMVMDDYFLLVEAHTLSITKVLFLFDKWCLMSGVVTILLLQSIVLLWLLLVMMVILLFLVVVLLLVVIFVFTIH